MSNKQDETTTKAAAKPAFTVHVPDKTLPAFAGVTFSGGVGHTDDPIRAHHCLEVPGAKVTKDGKPWPEAG